MENDRYQFPLLSPQNRFTPSLLCGMLIKKPFWGGKREYLASMALYCLHVPLIAVVFGCWVFVVVGLSRMYYVIFGKVGYY